MAGASFRIDCKARIPQTFDKTGANDEIKGPSWLWFPSISQNNQSQKRIVLNRNSRPPGK